MSHTVKSYDKDLQKIRENVFNMADLVVEMLGYAIKSINDPLQNLSEKAIITDRKIDKLDQDLEDRAIAILALRQPMAIDLRHCVAALKIAVIMERMGDLAKHVCKHAMQVDSNFGVDTIGRITNMININIDRISNCVSAYSNENVILAKEIYEQDKEIDMIYVELMSELELKMSEHGFNKKNIMKIILVIKNIERIGDYISVMSALVHYIYTGHRLAH